MNHYDGTSVGFGDILSGIVVSITLLVVLAIIAVPWIVGCIQLWRLL